MTDTDTGTDVSDVESTESSLPPNNVTFQPEPLQHQDRDKNTSSGHAPHHRTNHSGSVVINTGVPSGNRRNSSLGNQLDLVHRMVSRWGSMGGDEIDLEEDGGSGSEADDNNGSRPSNADIQSGLDPNAAGTHRRRRSAQQEIFQKKALQEGLEQVFEQYIDPDNNGECDLDEWNMGLRKLNVQLNDTQQRVLFKLMDIDNSGMVDKDEFIQTMMGQYDTEELNLLRQPILAAVREHQSEQLHAHSNSNLIGGQSQDWTDADLAILQSEMQAAMFAMVEPMQVWYLTFFCP